MSAIGTSSFPLVMIVFKAVAKDIVIFSAKQLAIRGNMQYNYEVSKLSLRILFEETACYFHAHAH